MAKPLPVKRTGAAPLSSATEARLREEGRRDALDEADRTMLATLITLDRRQQAQGEQLMAMAGQLSIIVDWIRSQQHAGNGHSSGVDPMAATMLAMPEGDEDG